MLFRSGGGTAAITLLVVNYIVAEVASHLGRTARCFTLSSTLDKPHGYYFSGCCQSNANLSPVRRIEPKPTRDLGHDRPPLGQGGGASFSVDFAADEVAVLAEVVVNLGVD